MLLVGAPLRSSTPNRRSALSLAAQTASVSLREPISEGQVAEVR